MKNEKGIIEEVREYGNSGAGKSILMVLGIVFILVFIDRILLFLLAVVGWLAFAVVWKRKNSEHMLKDTATHATTPRKKKQMPKTEKSTC